MRYEFTAKDGVKVRIENWDGGVSEQSYVRWNDDWSERDFPYAAERLFEILEERDLFAAELISRLGLDREAIDREGLPVGNEILKALDEKLVYISRLEQELELVRQERDCFQQSAQRNSRGTALDALLTGEEPPDELEKLAERLRTTKDEDVLVPSFAGQARIAWRWFREQALRGTRQPKRIIGRKLV